MLASDILNLTHVLAQIDPKPFSEAFGVPIGALLLVIVLLCGMVGTMFVRNETNRSKVLDQVTSFVDGHRKESAMAMKEMAEDMKDATERMAAAVTQSHAEMSRAMVAQARGFDRMFVNVSLVAQLENLKRRLPPGQELSQTEIAAAVQAAYQYGRDLDSRG